MSIKFLVLGGGDFGFWGGGGSADFIFMGARIFLKISSFDTDSPRAKLAMAQPRPRPFLSSSSSRGAPFFIFAVHPDAAPNAPFRQWNTEKTK